MTDRDAGLRALGLARILFGALALCRTTPILSPLGIPYLASAAPLLGWPTRLWHIGAMGVSLPSQVVAVLCVARAVALVLFTVGIRSQWFGVAAGVTGWIVLFQDAAAYINSMNLLCVGLVVLALSGAGSALALAPEREHDAPSARALTRALVVSVYAWSGLAKLNASWLSGDALAHFQDAGMVRGALAGAVLTSSVSRMVTSWMIAALELGMGPLLLWPRTRSLGIAVALAFHVVLEWTVHPDFFGLQIAVLLLSFASDRQPQRQGPVVLIAATLIAALVGCGSSGGADNKADAGAQAAGQDGEVESGVAGGDDASHGVDAPVGQGREGGGLCGGQMCQVEWSCCGPPACGVCVANGSAGTCPSTCDAGSPEGGSPDGSSPEADSSTCPAGYTCTLVPQGVMSCTKNGGTRPDQTCASDGDCTLLPGSYCLQFGQGGFCVKLC